MKKNIISIVYILLILILCGCSHGDLRTNSHFIEESTNRILSTNNEHRIISPTGRSFKIDVTHINLPGVTHDEYDDLFEMLSKLKGLSYVNLGKDNGKDGLTPIDLYNLINSYPNIKFDYIFNIYGVEVSLDTEILDFNHVSMDDNGQKVVDMMKVLRNPTSLDMDFTGVDNSVMEYLRDNYPSVDIQWRIWIGQYYSIRTDAERFVASEPSVEVLTENALDPLKYCTKIRFLDIGHNEITDISFLRSMPNLEAAVICLNSWSDLSPIKSCTKLNYLEINDTNCKDLSPLESCTSLEHLNVCNLGNVIGWNSISKLTNLKRLWIGLNTNISDEELIMLKQCLPNTEINTISESSDLGSWRWTTYPDRVERYDQLFMEMGYYMSPSNQSYYYHDPKY